MSERPESMEPRPNQDDSPKAKPITEEKRPIISGSLTPNSHPQRRVKTTPLIIALDQAQAKEPREDRRRRRTRSALLEAAQTLFATQNYEAVSIDDITEMADVSKATFYNHFADKEALAAAIFSLIHDHVAGLIDQDWLGFDQPRAKLARGCFLTVRFGLEHPDSSAALFRLTRDMVSLKSPLNQRVLAVVGEGLKDGSFSEAQVEDAALLVIGTVSTMIQIAIEGELADRLYITVERVVAGLLRALGVPPVEARSVAASAGLVLADYIK